MSADDCQRRAPLGVSISDSKASITLPIRRTRKSTKKHPGFVKNLCHYVTEFTTNTSLHGVRYFGERKRNHFEKVWWLAVFCVSLYLCIDLILKTYTKWDTSPVIVSFAQSPTPVWQIPFPAVTFCPETKVRQTVFNFTHYYHAILDENITLTPEERKRFEDITLVCDNHLYHAGSETANYSTLDYLAAVAPQFEDVLWTCRWMNKNESCANLFTPVLTEDGVCYTFNMLDRDDIFTNAVYHNKDFLHHSVDKNGWTLERGYVRDADMDTYPRRAMSSGQDAGLSMLMRASQKDFDYVCKGPVQGFRLLLHHPGEVPRVATQYFRASVNQEIVVTVKPDMMTTSESLRNYEPHRRQCYFASERELRFYKNYTQQNCDVECLTNYTLSMCGCVAYHMPHELLTKQVSTGISSFEETSESTDLGNVECDCLPACTSLTYNAEMSQAEFNWRELFGAYKINMSEFSELQVTRVTIFFKEMQFITSTRNELYGLTDFLANCGGLLGLFIGFSFLSAVETLYFLTFRLFCNIRRYGRHYWSGSPDLVNNEKYDYDK